MQITREVRGTENLKFDLGERYRGAEFELGGYGKMSKKRKRVVGGGIKKKKNAIAYPHHLMGGSKKK